MLKVKLLHPDARLPTRANPTDAGLDLYLDGEAITVSPGERKALSTGVSISIPEGYVALVKPRSGLAVRLGIDILAGVIDSSYRGEIMAVLVNHGGHYVRLCRGDRIAQLVIQKVELWNPVVVDELGETERGENGFGSSGK